MRVAKSLAVVAILAGSISLAGCGGDEGSSSGAAPDARTLLSETFSPKGGSAIKSATVELTVSGKLSDQTMVVVASKPAELDQFIRAEHDKWGRLIREARLNLGE